MDAAAARKRCEAATPEPWETHQEGDGFNSVRICKPISDGECQPVAEAEILGTIRAQAEANADFITHARTDLPAALEALEEAQEALGDAGREFERIRSFSARSEREAKDASAGRLSEDYHWLADHAAKGREAIDRILHGSKEDK